MDTKTPKSTNEVVTNNELEEIIDKVERLPESKRQVVLQKLEIYQGDLPHPDILKGYNELYPEAAKKIIDNGISETEHRRKMEEKYLNGNISAHKLGQIFGFIVALVIVLSGVFLIFTGHGISGTLLTGTTAVALIGLFTNGNKPSDNDKK